MNLVAAEYIYSSNFQFKEQGRRGASRHDCAEVDGGDGPQRGLGDRARPLRHHLSRGRHHSGTTYSLKLPWNQQIKSKSTNVRQLIIDVWHSQNKAVVLITCLLVDYLFFEDDTQDVNCNCKRTGGKSLQEEIGYCTLWYKLHFVKPPLHVHGL